MSKRAVIILGAGAPIAWGGPTTTDITKLLLEDSEFQTKNKENLALYIRNQLVTFYECETYEINFEHIINALETLADFLSESIKGTPPQFSGSKPIWFLLSGAFNEIENYRFEEYPQSPDKGLLFNLAKPGDSPYVAIGENNYKRYYVLKVIEHYLGRMQSMIHGYDVSCTDEHYNPLNDGLWEFYSKLKEEGYTIRFYTTNYDELLPKILKEKHQISLYSGFGKVNESPVGQTPNTKEILINQDVECYYNLHGSTYWYVGSDPSFENSFFYSDGNRGGSERETRSEPTNPSERTIIYNIVTGFSKLQRVSVEPLKSFFNSLAYDCINADILVSIGYSYSDPHINSLLKHAVWENNAKLLHITFSTDSSIPDFINMQPSVIKRTNHFDFEKTGSNWHITKEKKTSIYTGGFKHFLENKEWKTVL